MAKRLRRTVRTLEVPFELGVVETGCESLPFRDRSFDARGLAPGLLHYPGPRARDGWVARVLKPDGDLLLLEHVRARERRAL